MNSTVDVPLLPMAAERQDIRQACRESILFSFSKLLQIDFLLNIVVNLL